MENWYVSVHVNGKEILVISPSELCGVDDMNEELEEYIELAARNLLSFIGRAYTIEKVNNDFIIE